MKGSKNANTLIKITVSLKKKSGIITAPPEIIKLIREKFSIKNPSYMSRKFAPRLYAITPAGAFQVGLWNDIEHFIRSLNLPVSIELTDEFKAVHKPVMGPKKALPIEGFTYYDYQEDTINSFLEHGRGVALIGTGGGKALIIGGLCKTLIEHNPNEKILLIVPDIGLLNQLYYSFLNEFDIDSISRWGDGNLPDLSKNIIIANHQIMRSDIKYTLSVFENYDTVIIDEVHTLNEKKNQISKIVHNIHTPKKFGLTGTLPDSIMASWNVIGKTGPILYEKSSYELRKQKTITEVEIKCILCKHLPKPDLSVGIDKLLDPAGVYNAEYNYIMTHDGRNGVITKLATRLDGNVLVVVDRREYLDILEKNLEGSGKTVFIIHGDTPTDERTAIQNRIDTETGIVVLAMSKCFSTGISVKNLHYAIFAYMGKGGVKTVQTVGRILRLHASKTKAVIFDIADNLEYSLAHLRKRIAIYKTQKIDYSIKDVTF